MGTLYTAADEVLREGVRVSRNVMAVSSQEEFDRHAQMFLLWFIPHELIHTLETPKGGSWRREREASLLQPLGPYASPGVENSLQRFTVDLREPVPYPGEAFEHFLEDTTEYVHFIAYLDRYSWNRQLDLESLIRGAASGETESCRS